MTDLRAPATEARNERALAGAGNTHYGNVHIERAWLICERLFPASSLLIHNSLIWYTSGKFGHCRMRVDLGAVARLGCHCLELWGFQ